MHVGERFPDFRREIKQNGRMKIGDHVLICGDLTNNH